jgi:hypothetical protein
MGGMNTPINLNEKINERKSDLSRDLRYQISLYIGLNRKFMRNGG